MGDYPVQTWLFNALFAAAAAAEGGAPGEPPSLIHMLAPMWPFALVIVLMYFLWIRPQRVEQRKHQESLNLLKKNDRVVTIGGIFGVVTNVRKEADEVTLKVDEDTNTKIRVRLGAIARVLDSASEDDQSK